MLQLFQLFIRIDTNYIEVITEQEQSAFNNVKWWQDKQQKELFNVLAKMPHNILTIQVITIASENCFPFNGMIINYVGAGNALQR